MAASLPFALAQVGFREVSAMAWTTGRVKRIRALGWMVPMLAALITPSALAQAPTALNRPKRQVVTSVPGRKLVVMESGAVLRIFDVAVGADLSPSPTGAFQTSYVSWATFTRCAGKARYLRPSERVRCVGSPAAV